MIPVALSLARLISVLSESLDELSTLASTLFSPIPNRGQEPLPMINDHPLSPKEQGVSWEVAENKILSFFQTVVSVHTIMSFFALEISFPLEWQTPLWNLKPAQYIAHLLGHEGRGSLHSYLKNKGWITDLSSGPQSLARGFDMFRITTYLTLDGFSKLDSFFSCSGAYFAAENYRSVIVAVFKYLALLRDSQFPPYLQKEEIVMDTARFRFKEKGRPDDYASKLSARLPKPYPRELILSASSLTYPWNEYEDPEAGERKVREYLEAFRIQNGRVFLMAQANEFAKLEPKSDAQWESEPWYGTMYRVERFDENYVAQVCCKPIKSYQVLTETRQIHLTISQSCFCLRRTSLFRITWM